MMTVVRKLLLIAGALTLAVSPSANAELVDRGGGLVYDTILNVTWLQDANYAMTSGYSADGKMTWSEAVAWAANLSYYDSVRGVTYDDWRLPTVGPSNGADYNYNFSTAGNTDVGYNITSTASEMSYMHYVNLGNPGFHTTSGAVSGCYVSAADTCLDNAGPFINLQSGFYWSGTEYAPVASGAWNFNFGNGGQGAIDKSNVLFAWAVRPGDVAAATYLRVQVGIKPFQEGDATKINLGKNKYLEVAILTKKTFDAMQVNPATVRFGPAQAPINRYIVSDVNEDGNADMLLIFKIADTGIQECDTSATLTGNLYDGTAIEGSDSFTTNKCPKHLHS
jgi:hypothetical protein